MSTEIIGHSLQIMGLKAIIQGTQEVQVNERVSRCPPAGLGAAQRVLAYSQHKVRAATPCGSVLESRTSFPTYL